MAGQLEAIEIKRKSYFEFENAPYVCLDVEVSKPTARGGQTLVRLKMRNLITRSVFDKTFKAGERLGGAGPRLVPLKMRTLIPRSVFDKTFKAGERFVEPDLEKVEVSYQYSDGNHY